MEKYQLVKRHDRLGRMADTLEYSSVALPLARLDHALVRELEKEVPSLLEYEDGNLVIEHLYIERRMTPLNLYLQNGSDADVEHGVKEYGNAVKELMKANIFPGDMLYKNFGVTRHGRVVFYDYDEIEYLTDCNVRRVPAPRNEEDELSGEPWYRRPARHLSGDLRAVPARRPARARRLHEASRGLFRSRAVAGQQGQADTGRAARLYPYDTALRFCVRYPRFGATDQNDGAGDAQRAA